MAGKIDFAKGAFSYELPQGVVSDSLEVFGGELTDEQSAQIDGLFDRGFLTRGVQNKSLRAIQKSFV